MSKLLWGFLALTLFAAPGLRAEDKKTDTKKADEKKADDKKPESRRPGTRGQGSAVQPGTARFGAAPLLSDKDMEELKLSSEQKDKIGKLVKDYDTKAKEAQEELRKQFQGGQPDREKMREAMEVRTKARQDAESKITALLTDDQKKKFEEQKRTRGSRGGFPGGAGGFGGFTPFKLGQVIPGATKERLELNAAQKKQLEELEKDVKAKLEKILTDDQKKKLEQGGTGGGRGRPGADGTRPGGRNRPGSDNAQPRRPRPDQK